MCFYWWSITAGLLSPAVFETQWFVCISATSLYHEYISSLRMLNITWHDGHSTLFALRTVYTKLNICPDDVCVWFLTHFFETDVFAKEVQKYFANAQPINPQNHPLLLLWVSIALFKACPRPWVISYSYMRKIYSLSNTPIDVLHTVTNNNSQMSHWTSSKINVTFTATPVWSFRQIQFSYDHILVPAVMIFMNTVYTGRV